VLRVGRHDMKSGIARVFKLLLILLSASGCAYSIHQYNAGDFSVNVAALKNAKIVEAQGKKNYILAKFDTDFVDNAYQDLASKCPKGRITGVTSRYVTDLSFLSFTEKVELEGFCIPGK
jgi:hypothetical protein